eukprot:PhF_6_TR9098/c0_g1_i1/m.14166
MNDIPSLWIHYPRYTAALLTLDIIRADEELHKTQSIKWIIPWDASILLLLQLPLSWRIASPEIPLQQFGDRDIKMSFRTISAKSLRPPTVSTDRTTVTHSGPDTACVFF